MLSIPSLETAICSWPLLSSCAMSVTSAQLDIARVELRQRRVAELLDDLLDIRLDPRCRRQRFFMLQACERRLVLLV
jgi:hypothetical protein